MFNNSNNRARVVDGHLVRDESSSSSAFSMRRFLFVVLVGSLLVITNPANDFQSSAYDLVDQVRDRVTTTISGKSSDGNNGSRSSSSSSRRQRNLSDWAWQKLLDPPISVTNYGIFTIEEKSSKLVVSALMTPSLWSCSYFNEHSGVFCSTFANHVCHGKPLLYDPKSYAYTAHRCICFLLIGAALLSFCYCGRIPPSLASEPILRAVLTSVLRGNHASFLSLGMDLFHASAFVYPALVRMEKVIPTLQEGSVASDLGLPTYCDFIFYVVVLVLFLGGGSNALTNYFFAQEPCFGFDSTVAAAVGYCHAFPSLPRGLVPGVTDNTNPAIFSPKTIFWGYLPVTALLGGSLSHAVAWLLAGMFGVMLGQYHLDNQNWILALKQTFEPFFSNFGG